MNLDYESFRKMPWNKRVQLFNSISNEEKAELVRTHIRYWLDSRRDALTHHQIKTLEDSIELVTPHLYDEDTRAENQIRIKEFEQRASAVFTREQIRDAFTMHWDLRR